MQNCQGVRADLMTLCSDKNEGGGVQKKHPKKRKEWERERKAEAQLGSTNYTALRVWFNLWGFPQWKQHLMRGGFCERRWMESMCKASERLPGTHSHFFLTGFRQRTENVTFASYNKGGSVKAVKKKDLLETVQLCSRIHRMCITLRYYSSALF